MKILKVMVSLAAILLWATAPAQTREESFIVAQGGDPRNLSPLSSTAQQEKNVSNQVVERLINFSPDGSGFVPVLATEWEVIGDDTIQLKLREGVSFTNGEEFNAEAAKYSLEQMMAASPYATFVNVLERIEIVDDYTINVIGAGPTPQGLMLNALAMGSFMYPPVYTEEVGLLEGFGTEPIGTGPYTFVEWVKDDHITLQANPAYWNGEPGVDYLIFRSIPEGAARVAALEAGDIDFSIDIPLDSLPRLSNNPDLAVVAAEGGRVYRLTISTLDPDSPLADVNVRRALLYAVDPDSIIEFILQGRGNRVTQVVDAATFGFNPDIPEVEYDPVRAREMLAEAGYPDGIEINLEYPNGRYPQDKEISELLASQLAEAGVQTNQQVFEPGEFLNRLVTLELKDMFYSGSLTPPDAQFAFPAYTCGFRYSYYCDEAFDELYSSAATLVNDEERAATYQQLSQSLFDNAAIIPLFTMNDLYAHREGLEGWVPMRDQFLDFSNISLP